MYVCVYVPRNYANRITYIKALRNTLRAVMTDLAIHRCEEMSFISLMLVGTGIAEVTARTAGSNVLWFALPTFLEEAKEINLSALGRRLCTLVVVVSERVEMAIEILYRTYIHHRA